MATKNESLIYNVIPQTGAYPVLGETLKLDKTIEIDLDTVQLHGGLLTKTVALSLDPYMRGRMRQPDVASYSPPFTIGSPIGTLGVSKVIRSDNEAFPVGAHVYGFHEMSTYNVFTVHHIVPTGLKVVENKENLPWTNWVGAAGMPGLTAHWSFFNIGKPKEGETIYVSAASGAVGQVVSQLAKKAGLDVIGSAGSDDKVAYLESLGCFKEVFNYKTKSVKEVLKANPPDIFFDNVGGEQLEIVLDTIKPFGRIICCGAISAYNAKPYPISNLMNVVGKQLTMQGFIISGKPSEEFYATVPKMIASGELKIKEYIVKGLDGADQAFLDLLTGKAFGKVVISME